MEALRNTINTADALGYCKACPNFWKPHYCCYVDVEGAKTETIEAPACMLPFLSDQRQPEVAADKNSKESLADGAHPPNNGAQVSAIEKDMVHNLPTTVHKRKILKKEIKHGAQVHQDSALSGRTPSNLTPSEKELLHLISEEFLTPKQIAIRRKCKRRVVYKHLASLKKKGVINAAYQVVHKFGGTCAPSSAPIPMQQHAKGGAVHEKRLHGQEFNAGILYRDERYKEKAGQIIFIDGNTVRCYRDSIEVYSGQSFFADDIQKATAKSMEYWTRFFVRLENDLKVILVKPRAQNIKLVNQHYAEIGNELATDCEMKGDKIRIYAKEDGKLWFTIDNSFNLREAETLHPHTAKEDMGKVVKHFNDMRDNNPPTLSELMAIQQETAKGLNILVTHQVNPLPKDAEVPKGKSKISDLGGMYG